MQGQPGVVDADLGDISGLAARLSRQADPLSQYLGRQFSEGEKLVRLNRLLLQDAFPSELSKNQLDYLVMEENVSLQQGDSRVTGERMVYAKTNDLATVTGQPTWQMGPQEGAGEMLQFRPATKALTAYTNALMRLHLGAGGQQLWAAFGATTNSAATNRSLLVQSAWYEYQPGKADFHDRVITTSFAGAEAQGRLISDHMRGRLSIRLNHVQELVADRQVMFERGTPGVTNGPNAYQKITCEKVTAQATNGVMENLVAEGNLKFEQGLIHGTSQRGVYLYKDDTVVLLGDVHIISPEGEFKGPAFLIDRRQNRFFSRTGWTLMGYLKSHERAKP